MKHLHRSFTVLIMLSMILGLFSMPAFSSDVALAQTDGDVQSTTGPTPSPEAMQSLSESVGYIPTGSALTISGVPAYEWQHGCGPTAAGMVMGYWDGYLDARGADWLISGNSSTQTLAVNEAMASEASTPSHYSDYAYPEDDYTDYMLKDNSSLLLVGDRHVNNSIADFMQTSWSSRNNRYGWSWLSDMPLAMLAYAKMRNPGGYTVTSSTVIGMSWAAFQAEINAGRPVVFLVDTNTDGYTDHFIPAVGYDTTAGGVKMYAAYTTWDTNLHWFTFHPMSKSDNWGVYSGTTFKITSTASAVPVLVSPLTNSFTNNTAPDLDWNPAAKAYSYHLQVSLSPVFSGTVVDVNIIDAAGSSYGLGGLINGNKYYWRVRSQNISGAYSAWSAARNFTVDTSAPAAPLLALPVDNGPAIIGAPTFTWKASLGAAKYQFAYGTTTFPTDTVVEPASVTGYEGNSPEQTTLTYRPSVMPSGVHYWSVRAKDAAGNWGFWSTSFKVTTTVPKPAVPVLDLPATNFITSDDTPNLSWKSVPYGFDYHLQVSTSSTFSILVVPAFDTTTSGLNLNTSALADGKYYWRVQAINAAGSSAYTAARNFTVDRTPPLEPVLALPLTSSIGTPTFSWKASLGATKYQFAYGTTTFPTGTLIEPVLVPGIEYYTGELTTLTHKPTTLLVPVGDHYWSVRAKDAAGNWGFWRASFKVTITAPKPAVPALDSPITNYFTNDDTPNLSWKSVPYGVDYHLQVSTSSTFSILVVPAFDTTTSGLNLNTSALADGKYYWHVQAINATGSSAYTAARYFTVDRTSPPEPVLSTPAVVPGTSIGTPTFSWKASLGATKYQFAYAATDIFTSAGIVAPETLGVEYYSLESTALTHKPTTPMPLGAHYWSARAKDAAGNWGLWTDARLITILPPTPVAPVLNLPANDAKQDSYTVSLSWLAAANANIYEVQVDNVAAFSSVDFSYTSGVGEFSKNFSPLGLGKWYWRVRAKNTNNVYSAWSASRYFTILPTFDTQFNSSFDGWDHSHPGAVWYVTGGSLTTPGLMDYYTSSASYPATFTDFTYEAKMLMNYTYDQPNRWNGYGLIVRGTPTLFGRNDWKTAYYFTIYEYYDDNDTSGTSDDFGVACYEVAKISNGAWSWPVFNCSDVINFNDWNNLKVYANGANLKFYINDNLMWSSSISAPLSGRLGVFSFLDWNYYCYDYDYYYDYCWDGDYINIDAPIYVDWATAGEPVLPTSALSQEVTTNQWPAGFPSPMQKNKGLK